MGRFVTPLVLSLLSVIHAFNYPARECLLYKGRCVDVCPRDMHAYHTRCDGQTLSQRTCSQRLQYVIGYTCGWSRCDCNGNNVFDEQNGICVKREDCPEFVTKASRRKSRRGEQRHGVRKHKSMKVEVLEDTEPLNDK